MLALLLPAATATAQQNPDIDCENAVVQMELTYCAEKEWEAADAKLNTAYSAAMKSMREMDAELSADLKGAAETLKEAQRAWIPYRDKACAAAGFLARGGSMEPMLIYSCLAELTEQRTQQLEHLAEGLGN
ncbi:lysozyme inhibitor LprI family protein [Stappia sp. WLB 29]|uniref:lysozyme inhibitor LprI family protein n=1 Tax=Stappia sp. WLB 29 TaxID=2925220 RepID=UPI0020C0F62C|nr:lysozyme inhibitor LprI family protein [Stappia sp. WLB 29]